MKTKFQVMADRSVISLLSFLVALTTLTGCSSDYTPPPAVTISISPMTASVVARQTQQFTATVTNSTNTSVTWQVNSVTGGDATHGTVSNAGLYTAPASVPNPATVTVTAIAQADTTKTASATVTVAAPPAITVTVAPKTVNVQVTTPQAFTATVANTSNTAVTWQVNNVPGGNATVGTISAGGNFTAPAVVPSPAAVTVKAISVADNTKSDTASVTITAAPPVSVAVSPKRSAITTGQTQTFTASVTGSSNTAVTWEVDTVPGGNAGVGTITTTCVYTPPAAGGTHDVVARSVANASATGTSTLAVTDLAGVYTYHNDISRTGANTKEFGLTTSTVGTTTFGKLFSCTVDAAAYAQPLWVANQSIGGVVHNIVYVVTQHDSIYAFDADTNPCVTLWSKVGTNAGSLIPAGETWVTSADESGCGDLAPDIGIVGTPVIDPATKTIYLVTKTKNTAGTVFHQRLHALDLLTGAEKFSGPADIQATVTGSGGGSSGGMLSFDPKVNGERSALLLTNGHVVITWASHCDFGAYHGWVMSYSAGALAQEAVYNVSPNKVLGGIWMSGNGPAADSSGNIYFVTGNGTFDINTGGTAYGDAIVKVGPPSANTFPVLSFFSPNNQATLEAADADLGSGGLILLPDVSSGTHPQLLVQAGKDGRIFVADRNALGGFDMTVNNVVQELDNAVPGGMWGSPAYWNGHLYFGAAADQGANSNPSDPLRAFSFNTTNGQVSTSPTSTSTKIFAFAGPTPSVSSKANTAGTGVVWALDNVHWANTCPASGCQVVYAFDASDLGTKLWDSSQAASNRDRSGGAVKFTVPTVANGKVYVGGQNSLTVYGLLP